MYRMVTTAPYRHRPQIEASKGSAHHPPNRPLRQPRHSTTAPPNAHRPPAATHSPTPTPTHHTAKTPPEQRLGAPPPEPTSPAAQAFNDRTAERTQTTGSNPLTNTDTNPPHSQDTTTPTPPPRQGEQRPGGMPEGQSTETAGLRMTSTDPRMQAAADGSPTTADADAPQDGGEASSGTGGARLDGRPLEPEELPRARQWVEERQRQRPGRDRAMVMGDLPVDAAADAESLIDNIDNGGGSGSGSRSSGGRGGGADTGSRSVTQVIRPRPPVKGGRANPATTPAEDTTTGTDEKTTTATKDETSATTAEQAQTAEQEQSPTAEAEQTRPATADQTVAGEETTRSGGTAADTTANSGATRQGGTAADDNPPTHVVGVLRLRGGGTDTAGSLYQPPVADQPVAGGSRVAPQEGGSAGTGSRTGSLSAPSALTGDGAGAAQSGDSSARQAGPGPVQPTGTPAGADGQKATAPTRIPIRSAAPRPTT